MSKNIFYDFPICFGISFVSSVITRCATSLVFSKERSEQMSDNIFCFTMGACTWNIIAEQKYEKWVAHNEINDEQHTIDVAGKLEKTAATHEG